MKLLDSYREILATIQRKKVERSGSGAKNSDPAPMEPPRKPEPKRPGRLLHLGLDYGTSWSKMVFRDYEGRGREQSHVVFENGEARRRGEFRFPSLVCLSDGRLWFGSQAAGRGGAEDTITWPSVKIRMALPEHFYGVDVAPPEGLAFDDLAALSVAYLLQHGRRDVSAFADRYDCDPRMSFTVGVPMSDFDNPELRERFVNVARIASALERSNVMPDLRHGISVANARLLIDSARERLAGLPEPDPRQWVRPEVEAALLWAFRSPATEPGRLHAAVDVGAGTTSSSFFFVTKAHVDGEWIKHGLAFYGAACMPPGGDAVCKALAEATGQDPLAVRGRENEVIGDAGLDCLDGIVRSVVETYRISFRRGYQHYKRQSAWEGVPIIMLGGGTRISAVRSRLHAPAWQSLKLTPEILDVGQPDDLNCDSVSDDELSFLLVAYGLSFIDVDIPSAMLPSEIPPLDLTPKRIWDRDPENPDQFRPWR